MNIYLVKMVCGGTFSDDSTRRFFASYNEAREFVREEPTRYTETEIEKITVASPIKATLLSVLNNEGGYAENAEVVFTTYDLPWDSGHG